MERHEQGLDQLPDAAEEVGSIHTVQGYDLNYSGVIIGGDLRRDPATVRSAPTARRIVTRPAR